MEISTPYHSAINYNFYSFRGMRNVALIKLRLPCRFGEKVLGTKEDRDIRFRLPARGPA
jgi:hypothetical protein